MPKQEKQQYLDSLNALKEAEARITRLEDRQSQLRQQQDDADVRLSTARADLDHATERLAFGGSEAELRQVRDAIADAKQARDNAEEEIQAIDRVIDREREAVASALRDAHRQHRLYWLAVEAEEREKCKAAAEPFLRAYRAQVYASPGSSLPLMDYLRGMGAGGGLLDDAGISTFEAGSVTLAELGAPTYPPHSRYAKDV